MHNEVPVVEKHPLAVLDTLPPQRALPRFLELVLDLIDQAAQMRARRTSSDDKQVGDNEEIGDVQDGGIFTLFLDDGRYRFPCGLDGLVSGCDVRSSLIQLSAF